MIQVPGHTAGSAALHFAGHDTLRIGDAMGTLAVTTGVDRAAVVAVQRRSRAGTRVTRSTRGLEAGFVLPGHGQPWTGGLAEALRLARASETLG